MMATVKFFWINHQELEEKVAGVVGDHILELEVNRIGCMQICLFKKNSSLMLIYFGSVLVFFHLYSIQKG